MQVTRTGFPMQQSLPFAAEAEETEPMASTGPGDIVESASVFIEKDCTGGVAATYDPYSFNKEITRLDELNKMLTEVQQRLTKVNTRSLLLNVDVVTQFDPHMMASLNQMAQDCEACIARMSEVEATPQQDVCCQDEGETNQDSETCSQ